MRKNKIKNVFVHKVVNADIQTLSYRMSEFRADMVARRVKQSGISKNNKLEVIDLIIKYLKSNQ
ncbi:MAG: hypothetical protein PHG19_07185 [Anaerotignum sp.]|nr:hypothetical protein [Anaerotignum sp.]